MSEPDWADKLAEEMLPEYLFVWYDHKREARQNFAAALRAERERWQAPINETLRLANFLNETAAGGAGFCEHWGERVMQAVEPLRDIEAFAGRTLEHNRMLLDHNDKLVEETEALRRQIANERERCVGKLKAHLDHGEFWHGERDGCIREAIKEIKFP